MANKYLEKIAIVHLGLGYLGADKGDKVGGTILGGTLGAAAGGALGSLAGPGGLTAGYLAGGYLGGKAYSRVKDGFRSKSDMKKHLKRNGFKDD